MTYVERELNPLGFQTVSREGYIGLERQVILSFSHLKFQFDCVCPAFPAIRALGCPLHHREDFGGSWPVEEAKKVAAIIGN